MFEPKIPLIAAGVGFVLSLFIGLFSGASFPVFLLRAVAMAVFFGIATVVVHALIKKFLPELLESTVVSDNSDQQPDFGSMVDMTIGDEEEMPFEPKYEIDAESDETAPMDGFSEKNEQKDEPARVVNKTAQVSSLPEKKEVDVSTLPDTPAASPKTGGSEGLDELPDLQDFVPEEKTDNEDHAEGEVTIESSGTGFSVPDVSVDAVETETMARAIRTILLKDN